MKKILFTLLVATLVFVGGVRTVIADRTSSRVSVFPDGARTVLIGDSITFRNGINNPLTVTSSVANSVQNLYYFNWLNALTGHPFNVVKNAGVSSETTSQMLARFSTDVLGFSPTTVSIMGGTNDLQLIATSTSISNLTSMADQSLSAGSYVILWTIPPRSGTGGNPLDPQSRSQRSVINQALRSYALLKPNVLLCDTEEFTSDPISTTGISGFGGWLAGFASDGVHPSSVTSTYRMAQNCVDQVKRLFKPFQLIKSASDTFDGAGSPGKGLRAEGQNILTHSISILNGTGGSVAAGGGLISGSGPSGTTVQVNSGTPTIVVSQGSTTVETLLPTGAVGTTTSQSSRYIQFEVGATGASSASYLYQTSTTTIFTLGKFYEFSGVLEIVNGAANVHNIQIATRVSGGSANFTRDLDSTSNTASTVFPLTSKLTFVTPRLPITAADTNIRFEISFGTPAPSAGTATTTLRVSNLAWREYSTAQPQ